MGTRFTCTHTYFCIPPFPKGLDTTLHVLHYKPHTLYAKYFLSTVSYLLLLQHMYVCMYIVHMYIYVCIICMYACMYVCMYITCMYACTCMYKGEFWPCTCADGNSEGLQVHKNSPFLRSSEFTVPLVLPAAIQFSALVNTYTLVAPVYTNSVISIQCYMYTLEIHVQYTCTCTYTHDMTVIDFDQQGTKEKVIHFTH